MSAPQVTMADVARAAGVARSTVSKALRGDPEIPEATRVRVRQAATAVGYAPNPLVAALMAQLHHRRRRTEHPAIAWLDAWSGGLEGVLSPTFDDYLAGARERAAELGYGLERFALPPSEAGRRTLWRALHHRGLAGLLVPPVPEAAAVLPGAWDHFAAAAIGFSLRAPRLHRVCAHYYQNMDLACQTLHRQGFRRVGFCISERLDSRVAHAWQAEYAVWARAGGLRPHLHQGRAPEPFLAWLGETRPDALLCLETWLFRPWLEQWNAAAAGPPVPVFTLGYHPSRPEAGGVDQHSAAIGRAAIDLIVAQLHRNERGLPAHPKTVLIEGAWRAPEARGNPPAALPGAATRLDGSGSNQQLQPIGAGGTLSASPG